MILSHRHRFIFIKTNKTAGTSIEIALSRFCGPDDVITPISAEDEALRREHGYPGPRNYAVGGEASPTAQFYNHMSAAEIRRLVPGEVWDDYFKFCVERNPWDRVVSLYWWRCRMEPRPTMSEFLSSGLPSKLREKGRDLYTIDGQVVVDRVCLYEQLDRDLEAVREQLGLPEALQLPRAKSRFRQDRRSYRDQMSADEAAVVASWFPEEIEDYGYRF